MANKHKGSNFDSFLEEEGLLEEVEAKAATPNGNKHNTNNKLEPKVPPVPNTTPTA